MGKSTYTEEIAAEICERLSTGEPLRQICRDTHMPSWRTVYDWIEARPDFAARFARGRDIGYDAIAEETLELVDTVPERITSPAGDRIDPGYVQWQRIRVEQRLKLLAKWSPRYRENTKVELTGAGGGPVELSESQKAAKLSAIIAAAHARQQAASSTETPAESLDGDDLV